MDEMFKRSNVRRYEQKYKRIYLCSGNNKERRKNGKKDRNKKRKNKETKNRNVI